MMLASAYLLLVSICASAANDLGVAARPLMAWCAGANSRTASAAAAVQAESLDSLLLPGSSECAVRAVLRGGQQHVFWFKVGSQLGCLSS